MKSSRTSLPENAGPDIPHLLCPPPVKKFQEMVLDYYRNHGRDLAWRRTDNPYHILVSEIMLQQTQVERVSKKFPAFIHEFPDPASLARAPLAEVIRAWQGMGYNRRAISLQGCALRIVDEYGGVVPQDPGILVTFPGIGRATAASICAFAFGMPVVFIETNIRRVFIHWFFFDDDPVDDADILPLVEGTLYRKDPRVWYWALMDLGSDLKKTVPNPNRRSSRYVRQPAFEGSDRKIRGMILRMLLEQPGRDTSDLVRDTGEDRERVERILSALEKEGFTEKSGTGIAVRSR